MAWILVPCLVALRREFNLLAPDRDRTSDGSIGDSEHSQTSSDHNPDETGRTPYEDADSTNEVHAIDVDRDLNRAGWDMQRAVDLLIRRQHSGEDDRLQNVIFNGWIWSRSWGWIPRRYTGANPHDKHAHFSARYTTATESDTAPWGLLEDDEMTKTELLEALRDPKDPLALAVRAAAWQYRGGGIPEGMSTLAVLNEVVETVREIKEQVTPVPPTT